MMIAEARVRMRRQPDRWECMLSRHHFDLLTNVGEELLKEGLKFGS